MNKFEKSMTTVIFKGIAIVRQYARWHVDFKDFKTLYEAKGYILRKLKD